MNINISAETAIWYKEELNLIEGDFVRFFVRYGGYSPIQQGFSLGISRELPRDIGAKSTLNGITFYIEERDLWYFDHHDLSISLDCKTGEPELDYNKKLNK